jgi:hypothetical protein
MSRLSLLDSVLPPYYSIYLRIPPKHPATGKPLVMLMKAILVEWQGKNLTGMNSRERTGT